MEQEYRIIYNHFAKPIVEMVEEYKCSALTQQPKLVNKKVSKCFDALVEALQEQLNDIMKYGKDRK